MKLTMQKMIRFVVKKTFLGGLGGMVMGWWLRRSAERNEAGMGWREGGREGGRDGELHRWPLATPRAKEGLLFFASRLETYYRYD